MRKCQRRRWNQLKKGIFESWWDVKTSKLEKSMEISILFEISILKTRYFFKYAENE